MAKPKPGRPSGLDKLIHKPRGRHATKTPEVSDETEQVVEDVQDEVSYILENKIFSPEQYVDYIRFAVSDGFISKLVKEDLTSDDVFCILGFYVDSLNKKTDELKKMVDENVSLKARLVELINAPTATFSSDVLNNPTWN